MSQETTNNRWKEHSAESIIDTIKRMSAVIEDAPKHVHPTAIFLRVPEGIHDIKVFQPISGNHPALVKHGLTGEWFPVAMYGARGKDAEGNDTFGALCTHNFKSELTSACSKESCYRITFYPHPFERIWPDWNGGYQKAVDVFVRANQKEYCGLDLSDVIKGMEQQMEMENEH